MAETKRRINEVKNIAELLRGYGFTFDCEDSLQAGVEAVLILREIHFVREAPFGTGNRIDFWLPDDEVGIECKIKGAPMAVARQLLRYANVGKPRGLVLVTSRMRHREVPTELAGVPVEVVCVAEGAL